MYYVLFFSGRDILIDSNLKIIMSDLPIKRLKENQQQHKINLIRAIQLNPSYT